MRLFLVFPLSELSKSDDVPQKPDNVSKGLAAVVNKKLNSSVYVV